MTGSGITPISALYDAALAACVEFDALLNQQGAEGFSAAEVERLAEFRERHVRPLLDALKEAEPHVWHRLWPMIEATP